MPALKPVAFHREEHIAHILSELFERNGYEKFRMSKFEEYDFYTENKDFLPSKHIITFTGLDGKLMALRPDVTMSIVKRTRATPGKPERLYYNERIYRASADANEYNEYKEIPQMGAEFIGKVTQETNFEITSLALGCLAHALGLPSEREGGDSDSGGSGSGGTDGGIENFGAIDGCVALEVSHMGFITGLLESIGAPARAKREIMRCWEAKNAHGLSAALAEHGVPPEDAKRAGALLSLSGGYEDASGVFARARQTAVNAMMREAIDETEALFLAFESDPLARRALRLDFSAILNEKYYNGLFFKGYAMGAPRAALIGGRYDNLIRRMAERNANVRSLEAIGFALYVDELPNDGLIYYKRLQGSCRDDRLGRPLDDCIAEAPNNAPAAAAAMPMPLRIANANPNPLRIALPKGRMGDKAYGAFAAIGHPYGSEGGDSRKLEIPDATGAVLYLLIKPQDVPVYVERGAADIGVAGKDVLLELGSAVYEMLDLGFGACALAVAAPDRYDGHESQERALRVATKYANVARRHFSRQNQDIDVIKLNGSIELAPLLGLSDVIVDVVETGVTLRENGLSVVEEIAKSSARLISNVSSYKFRNSEIDRIAGALRNYIAFTR